MPRAQPKRAAQGLPYGQGQAHAEAQEAIPLPDNRTPSPPSAPPGVPGGNQAPPGGEMAALAAMLAGGGPTAGPGLGSPTEAPDEPITAGLSSGPGPGPEAIAGAPAQRRATVADFFAIAAQVFGNDPQVADMAARARRRGL